MHQEKDKKLTVKDAAGYVFKSTFMLTHAKSVADDVSRSYNNIKNLLNSEETAQGYYPEKEFNVDAKGRLIPKDYDDIIKFQAAKLTAAEMIDYIDKLPPDADKEGEEILQMAGNKMLAHMDALSEKAQKSAKIFKIAARVLAWSGLVSIACIVTFLFKGKFGALFAIPSVLLMLAASFKYAMRAAIHSEKRLYQPSRFIEKYGLIGWMFN